MARSDYDFDIPAGQTAGRTGVTRKVRDLVAKMPAGASFFVASPHKSNTVAAAISAERRARPTWSLKCSRAEKDGVEGYRVWRFKDGEK